MKMENMKLLPKQDVQKFIWKSTFSKLLSRPPSANTSDIVSAEDLGIDCDPPLLEEMENTQKELKNEGLRKRLHSTRCIEN